MVYAILLPLLLTPMTAGGIGGFNRPMPVDVPLPDLKFEEISYNSEKNTVNLTIINSGRRSSGETDVSLKVYRISSDVPSDAPPFLQKTLPLERIATEKNVRKSVKLPSKLPEDSRILIIGHIDPDNKIRERSERNNRKSEYESSHAREDSRHDG